MLLNVSLCALTLNNSQVAPVLWPARWQGHIRLLPSQCSTSRRSSRRLGNTSHRTTTLLCFKLVSLIHSIHSCCYQWIHANRLCLAVPAGDFFSGEIPPADLYILARIIHDWPEEKCLTLLRKICDTCKPGYCTHAGVCLYPRTRCLRCHESRATMSQRSLSFVTCCK